VTGVLTPGNGDGAGAKVVVEELPPSPPPSTNDGVGSAVVLAVVSLLLGVVLGVVVVVVVIGGGVAERQQKISAAAVALIQACDSCSKVVALTWSAYSWQVNSSKVSKSTKELEPSKYKKESLHKSQAARM
jgi:hypothetical protein